MGRLAKHHLKAINTRLAKKTSVVHTKLIKSRNSSFASPGKEILQGII